MQQTLIKNDDVVPKLTLEMKPREVYRELRRTGALSGSLLRRKHVLLELRELPGVCNTVMLTINNESETAKFGMQLTKRVIVTPPDWHRG